MSTMKRVEDKKLATATFDQCPACRSKELIQVDSEVICGRCPWDSCEVSVSAGLMDDWMSPSRHNKDARSKPAHKTLSSETQDYQIASTF